MGNPVALAIQIFTRLGTGVLLDAILKDRAFGQMIQKTGGAAMRIDGEDATERFASLLDRIKNRYVMGFAAHDSSTTEPSSVTSTAPFHAVKLKLTPEAAKRHPELLLLTSEGHYEADPFRQGEQLESVEGKEERRNPR
jgi:hypothetical protein